MVEDNGVGINRRYEFFNLSSPQKLGMGLGLGIIKTLLKITKEQLPLKQNMEKELVYRFASYN
jgi:C4-dicarboxylate-specific signal transduction histidine kinase